MQRNEVLNNVTHEHLIVKSEYSALLKDDITSTLTYTTEFVDIQKEYPILCRKNPDGEEYQAIVFFGFEKNENLFLVDIDSNNQKNPGWNAEYVPAVMARGPFSIGVHREFIGGVEKQNAMVHVDISHPKIAEVNGQRLFLENGGNSPFLNHIVRTLEIINDGIPLTRKMFDHFNKYGLLEPVVLDIEFLDQSKLKISGFETISLKRMSQLRGAELEDLNKSGFLQAAYYMVASMSNVKKLIDLKNRKILNFRGKNN